MHCAVILDWALLYNIKSSQQNNVPECIEHVQTAPFVMEQPAE